MAPDSLLYFFFFTFISEIEPPVSQNKLGLRRVDNERCIIRALYVPRRANDMLIVMIIQQKNETIEGNENKVTARKGKPLSAIFISDWAARAFPLPLSPSGYTMWQPVMKTDCFLRIETKRASPFSFLTRRSAKFERI